MRFSFHGSRNGRNKDRAIERRKRKREIEKEGKMIMKRDKPMRQAFKSFGKRAKKKIKRNERERRERKRRSRIACVAFVTSFHAILFFST